MIGLRVRWTAWFSLALLTIFVGHASAQVPATLSASFTPSTVVAGGSNTSTYDLTISNPNGTTLSGIAVSLTYPTGITGGTVGSVSCLGSSSFSSTGFSADSVVLAAGASCDIPVSVQAASTASGPLIATTSTVTSTQASPGAAASATLTVTPLAATSFSVVAGTPITVFAQDSVTITCLDQNGN